MTQINFSLIGQENKIFIKVSQSPDRARCSKMKLEYIPNDIQKFSLKQSKMYYGELLAWHKECASDYDIDIELIKRLPSILQNMYYGVDKDIINKFCVGKESNSHNSTCQTFLFELPTIPHIALLQLGYISFIFTVFLNQNSHLIKSTLMNKHFTDAILSDDCSESVDSFKTLLDKILNLIDQQENYQATKQAILSINKDYHHIPFISLLNAKNLDENLYKKMGQLALNCSIPLKKRIIKILTTLQCYIHDDQIQKANFFVNNINLLAKENLFSQCLSAQGYMHSWNSETEDDEIYGWDSKEWEFIIKSKFSVRKDGRIQILINDSNALNHLHKPNLESALKSFFYKLKLEISCDSQLDKEIIFSPEASNRLKNSFVHADLNYFMQLMRQKNNYFSLFRQAHRHYNDHQTNFNKIPLEITDKIASLSSTNLDVSDVQATLTHVLNNRV